MRSLPSEGRTEIPPQMRAVALTARGGFDKLEYRVDWPTPRPASGEVLVAVAACGVNNTDLNTRVGWYSRSVVSAMTEELATHGAPELAPNAGAWNEEESSFPRIQGSAIAGRTVAVGDDVPSARIGERVLVDPVVRDPSRPRRARGVAFLGSELHGGFAEYAAVPATNAWRVQAAVSDIELASFPVSHTTAEEMLDRAGLTAGETLLVTGASGGVGTALVQLAKLRHAYVVAVTAPGKEDRLRAIGADWCVPRGDELTGTIARLLGDRSIDVVCDVVGGPGFQELLRLVRRGGRYVSAGAIAGPLTSIDLRDVIDRDMTLLGVASPEADATRRLVSYIESDSVRPLVDSVFTLERLVDAQRRFLSKRHVGKIVIDVSERQDK